MTKHRMPPYAAIFQDDKEKSSKARAVWKQTIEVLQDRGEVEKTLAAIVDRYARVCAEYHVLYPVASAEGPVMKGQKNGGFFYNLNWAALERMQDRMAKLEDQLKLDLKSSSVLQKRPQTKRTAADAYLD